MNHISNLLPGESFRNSLTESTLCGGCFAAPGIFNKFIYHAKQPKSQN